MDFNINYNYDSVDPLNGLTDLKSKLIYQL